MPSFVVHGLVPILLLLALRLARPKVALWMLPFTFLPDLDFWIGIHRATFSNIFILVPFALGWYLYKDHRPSWSPYFGVATYYLASHLVMDLFAGGVVVFWPIWDQNFFWFVQIVVNTRTGERDVTSDPGTSPGAPEVTEFFRWLSPIEAAMLALTLVVVAGTLAYRWWQRRPRVVLEEIDER